MMKSGLFGVDANWIGDTIIGIGFALFIILLSAISPGFAVIGLPNISSVAGTIGKWIIIVICASISETLIFQEFILDFFKSKLKFPFFISAVACSIVFSLFHYYAYGSLSSMGGSFISAFVVSMGFCYLVRQTKSIWSAVVAHGLLNAYLITKLAVVFG